MSLNFLRRRTDAAADKGAPSRGQACETQYLARDLEIVSAFADHCHRHVPSLIHDASQLPASRDEIRASLLRLRTMTPPGLLRGSFEHGLMLLTRYQPGVGAAPIDPAVIYVELPERAEDLRSLVERLAQAQDDPRARGIIDRQRAEAEGTRDLLIDADTAGVAEALATFLRRYGVAPPPAPPSHTPTAHPSSPGETAPSSPSGRFAPNFIMRSLVDPA